MVTRPSFIIDADWKLLKEKYKGDKKLERIIKKIENNYPIQYLIGYVDFYKNKIFVNKNVLIPRFETELLVDKLIKYIAKYEFKNPDILDLCTGSGCIAISLKNGVEGARVFAIDKSFKALRIAKKNARKNRVRIGFKRQDILKNINVNNNFSIIVSNPPYVKLDEEVSLNTRFEPNMALYPGKDDLVFYKKILDKSSDILYNKNIIAFEIGSTQAKEICKYASKLYPKAKIEVEQDYNGYDRFIFIFNNCE